jgi:hypothetical protein
VDGKVKHKTEASWIVLYDYSQTEALRRSAFKLQPSVAGWLVGTKLAGTSSLGTMVLERAAFLKLSPFALSVQSLLYGEELILRCGLRMAFPEARYRGNEYALGIPFDNDVEFALHAGLPP